MKMLKLEPAHRSEFLVTTVLYQAIVCVMMACFGYAAVQLGQRLVPQWQNQYLVPISIAAAIEAMWTERMIKDTSMFSLEWFYHRAAEWIVILAALKGMLYLLRGPAQILKDVLLWDEDFFNTFFTSEYLAAVLITLLIWVFATQFMHVLLQLEESLEDLALESEGVAVKDRQIIRRDLESLVFRSGLLLLVIIAVIHMDLSFLHPSHVSLRTNVLLLLVYFLLGFVLMALSQYFILRGRWYLQKIPVSPGIAAQWASYSLLLLGASAILVLLLPTGYSAELFRSLQMGVLFLVGLVSYLLLLLAASFFLLLQFLSRSSAQMPFRPAPLPPPPLLQATPEEPDLLLQVLKSFLFWTFFFGLIFFSFRYYFSQRKNILDEWKEKSSTRWLAILIQWLLRRWQRLNRQVEAGVETGVRSLGMSAAGTRLHLPSVTGVVRGLPPRHQVLLTYASMLRWNEKMGFSRKDAQTPQEYARILTASIPSAAAEIDAITQRFVEARYTRHEILLADADQMREQWGRLKSRIRAHRLERDGLLD
jgi:hypothetical protein